MDIKLLITGCVFILDNKSTGDIRKNDLKNIKVLLDNKNQLITVPFEPKGNIKDLLRNKLSGLLEKNIYHLEQVYTLAEEKYYCNNEVNIIYIAITNKENLKETLNDYKLIEFDVLNNNTIIFGNEQFKYNTEQRVLNGSLEYIHNIDTQNNIELEKELLQLLIAYKHLRSRLDNTDIIFKFMPSSFTLEDVRLVYEKITNKEIDKSNFRKKTVKYCEPINEVTSNKGFRPSQLYKYKSNFNDLWI